jgi:hypothetical protein
LAFGRVTAEDEHESIKYFFVMLDLAVGLLLKQTNKFDHNCA